MSVERVTLGLADAVAAAQNEGWTKDQIVKAVINIFDAPEDEIARNGVEGPEYDS